MIPKAYEPQATEDRIYAMWEDSGAFKADVNSKKEPFAISMPPPNATGQLHLGHAVMLALEDIFIRFARMRGKEALWVPGTDHAAIATEAVVIKKIQKEEKIPDPRAKLGRHELVRRIQEFVGHSQSTIRNQVRKMGTSCDWSREKYTMDPALARCTNEVFTDMVETGVMYRGERVVNWDTALQTTISDDEIEYKDSEAVLYTLEYLSAQQTGGEPLYVATSRPETKLGDTALAVHPDDERYKGLVGKSFEVTWPHDAKVQITIIADHSVDPAFGTGAIGVTPFHSKVDFEMWQRHKKEMTSEPRQVIGEDGKMTVYAGKYAGLTTLEAREKFIEGLREQGRIKSELTYVQPLSLSYRSGKPIEPLPKLQWFIDVNKKVLPWKGKTLSIKEVMQDTVRSGMITIIPDRFEKTYFQWIDNLQDWCVSRQIWWGHRIPVWYCIGGDHCTLACKHPLVSVVPITQCPHCGTDKIEQDTDTLDTWFGVSMWTWATLVDPTLTADHALSLKEILERSPDVQKFHPTQIMETGYDILFFWVARMILMTTYTFSRCGIGKDESDRIPFKTVYLHGLIRSRDGKKMSKSHPETMIDPLDMIQKYGADALRLSMIVGQSPGNDSRLYEEKIAGYRNFVNKLWNASRFVLMQCEAAGKDPHELMLKGEDIVSLADRALFSKLQMLVLEVTSGLEEYRLSEVGEKIYSFVWDFYCDWYLELSKGSANLTVLVDSLRIILQLLHPFCPFVTEELWASVRSPKSSKMLIQNPWPVFLGSFQDEKAEADLDKLIRLIRGVRKLRIEKGFSPTAEVIAEIRPFSGVFTEHTKDIERLAKLKHLHGPGAWLGGKRSSTMPQFAEHDFDVLLFVSGPIDPEADRRKLESERNELLNYIKSIETKFENKQFTERAPEKVIIMEKEKLQETKDKLKKIEERLKSLK